VSIRSTAAAALSRLGTFGVDQRSWQPDPPIPTNGSLGMGYGTVAITNDTALRNSAVWACLALRADLVSSFGVGVFRTDPTTGFDVTVTKPDVLTNPSGPLISWNEWAYSSQVDLDRAGNAFGLVTEFSALKSKRWPLGIPAQIELQQLGAVQVRREKGELRYTIGGKDYGWAEVWHEKAYTIAGLDVGLSPIAYAAYALGGYLSAQQFALDWFSGSGMPAASLKNTQKVLGPGQASEIKNRYRASVKAGDVFVHGVDWELKPISAVSAQSEFVNTMAWGVPDIARFFGVPADLIDGAVAGQSITYANLSQRNLQFLITKLGPAVGRREVSLSTLTAAPRMVRLDTQALLRLDHLQQAQLDKLHIDGKLRVPSELRARDNLLPYTPEQLAEMATLFPMKAATSGEPVKADA
jgi:HK97 family phage portal protein